MASAVQVLYCMKKDMTFLNPGLICIPEVIIACKVRDREFMNREFIQISIFGANNSFGLRKSPPSQNYLNF